MLVNLQIKSSNQHNLSFYNHIYIYHYHTHTFHITTQKNHPTHQSSAVGVGSNGDNKPRSSVIPEATVKSKNRPSAGSSMAALVAREGPMAGFGVLNKEDVAKEAGEAAVLEGIDLLDPPVASRLLPSSERETSSPPSPMGSAENRELPAPNMLDTEASSEPPTPVLMELKPPIGPSARNRLKGVYREPAVPVDEEEEAAAAAAAASLEDFMDASSDACMACSEAVGSEEAEYEPGKEPPPPPPPPLVSPAPVVCMSMLPVDAGPAGEYSGTKDRLEAEGGRG